MPYRELGAEAAGGGYVDGGSKLLNASTIINS